MARRKKTESEESVVIEDVVEDSTTEVVDATDGADDSEVATEEVDYKEMFSKCQSALDDAKNKYLYLYAEFDNYKKRNRTLAEDKFKDGRNAVLVDMFNVIDNLDRALECIKDDSAKEGVLMIKKQMLDILSKYGVEEIDAMGAEFDPKYHNAIMNTPDSENSGKVVGQAQKGYRIGDKVLRYAQVVVAE